jgi:segregation and condensation protein B
MTELKQILEAALFVSTRPLSLGRLKKRLPEYEGKEIEITLDGLVREYNYSDRSVEIVHVAGGYQMRTRPQMKRWVARFAKERDTGLTRAVLEVLGIIAYRQPVTKGDIDRLRGVDSARTIGQLLDRGLVEIAGRDGGGGQEMLFRTTRRFLEIFGINDTKDLPTLRELRLFEE